MRIKQSHSDRVIDTSVIILLVLISLLTLYPLWYTLIASFSDPFALAQGRVILFPKSPTLEAYQTLFRDQRIWTGYRNSLFYTFFGTFLNLTVTMPAGYALSRKGLFGRRWVMLFFVFTMYFSGGLIPSYINIRNLGLINTVWVLLLPGIISVYNMIIVRSFFESSIPDALYEAVLLDGCKHFLFFFRIVLPLSPAILAVMVLYYALGHWNAYFNAMIYISDEQLQTLQVIMRSITATVSYTQQEMMSAEEMVELVRTKALIKYALVIVASLPVLILYPFVQKFFIHGIMIGSVKG